MHNSMWSGAAQPNNQSRFLLRLADTGGLTLLALFDIVLGIIGPCSQSEPAAHVCQHDRSWSGRIVIALSNRMQPASN